MQVLWSGNAVSELSKDFLSVESEHTELCHTCGAAWLITKARANMLWKDYMEKEMIGAPVTQQCDNVTWTLGPADSDTATEWKRGRDKVIPSLGLSAGPRQFKWRPDSDYKVTQRLDYSLQSKWSASEQRAPEFRGLAKKRTCRVEDVGRTTELWGDQK